jgi:hypothetical protein
VKSIFISKSSLCLRSAGSLPETTAVGVPGPGWGLDGMKMARTGDGLPGDGADDDGAPGDGALSDESPPGDE